jgi:hypothetical protein
MCDAHVGRQLLSSARRAVTNSSSGQTPEASTHQGSPWEVHERREGFRPDRYPTGHLRMTRPIRGLFPVASATRNSLRPVPLRWRGAPGPGPLRRYAGPPWPRSGARRRAACCSHAGADGACRTPHPPRRAGNDDTRSHAVDARDSEEDLGGEQSPGRTGCGSPATGARHHGLDGGGKPRGRRLRKKRNDEGATAAVTQYGCGRGGSSRGVMCVAGECGDRPRLLRQDAATVPGNATNLRVGSGMQQARDSYAEEAVEVVQNHGDGTGARAGSSGPKSGGNVGREWTRKSMSTERRYGGRTRERASRRIPGEEDR